ncbi:Phenazine biosynthesis-like domain-containing protein [Orchesella cincta]|uniref:Phenazine biosynthesis-like domain-containing protein n=1 Tax=Orchesella cincta TaxID=48709 RepID=A0A1D2MYU9_ORCCI|nr:Phenazine biosynthesis-like domain-containing protein [Orchesella cincta]
MSLVPIYFVDAFTTEGNSAFTGNAAAVCFLDYDDDISDDMKQKIASEINLSETAFVSEGWTKGKKLATAEGSQLYRRTLRWFTPSNEVQLCGHATVASTKALVEAQLTDKYLDPATKTVTVNFESKFRGKLGAAVSKDSGRITLNFPSNPTHKLNKGEHPWVDEMIVTLMGERVSPELVDDIQYSPGTKILLVRLSDSLTPDELRQVSPDFKKLLNINTGDFVHDIIVTVKGVSPALGEGAGPNFYSRFFAPWDGIDEDPVTGLAHTVLTPYWTHEFSRKESREIGTLHARQHSTRGGDVYCTLLGDRVNLAGEARVTIKGQLFV